MEAIFDELEDLLQLTKNFETKVKAFVVNREIPLDTRWELFCRSGFGENSLSIVNFDSFENVIGELGVAPYETIGVITISEYLEDSLLDPDECCEKAVRQYNDFREEVLHKFIRTFINCL